MADPLETSMISSVTSEISVNRHHQIGPGAKQTFWASATVSITKPSAQRTIPAMSLDVPNGGLESPSGGSETAGEFKTVRGKETVQT